MRILGTQSASEGRAALMAALSGVGLFICMLWLSPSQSVIHRTAVAAAFTIGMWIFFAFLKYGRRNISS